MSLPKNKAMGLVGLVLIVGLALFLILPSGDMNEPTGPDLPGQNETDNDPLSDESKLGDIDVEGIATEPDGTIILNPLVLSNNHRTQLLNTSVKLSYDTPEEDMQISRFGDKILQVQNRSFGKTRQYSNGVIIYSTANFDGKVDYGAKRGSTSSSTYHKSNLYESLFTDMRVSNVSEIDDGVRLRLASSDNLSNLEIALSGVDSLNDASAEVEITNDGIIRSMRLEIIGRGGLGIPQTQVYNYTIQQLGGVNVQEPVWVQTVEEKRAIIDPNPDTQNNWLLLEHNGLAEIPEGSQIQILSASGKSASVELDTSVNSGDDIYLSPNTPSDWEAYINQEPVDKGRVQFSDDSEIILEIVNDQNGEVTKYYSDTILLDR